MTYLATTTTPSMIAARRIAPPIPAARAIIDDRLVLAEKK